MSRPRPILAGSMALGAAAALLMDVARDEVDAIQAAENKFDRAVKDVPDDATLTQAVNSLRNEAANVQATDSDPQTAAKC